MGAAPAAGRPAAAPARPARGLPAGRVVLCILALLLLCLPTTRAACESQTLAGTTGTIVMTRSMLDSDSDACAITVSPAYTDSEGSSLPVTSLWLHFQEVFLFAAEMHVYDGSSSASGEVLWSCIACGEEMPPPMRARSGHAFIRYRATPSQGATRAWQVQYYAAHEELGVELIDPIDDLPEPLVVDLLAARSSIEAPTYYAASSGAMRMPRSLEFVWRVVPPAYLLQGGHTKPTALLVTAFNLPNGAVLRVRDGSSAASAVLAEFAGGGPPPAHWVFASGTAMRIELKVPAPPGDDNDNDDGGDGNEVFTAFVLTDSDSCSAGPSCGCGALASETPLVLSGRTMAFTDGSSAYGAMHAPDVCSWVVEPDVQDLVRVTMIVDWVSIKRVGGYLKVYDAPDDNDESALLWGCDGCDAVVPPPLVSTGGALFVSLLSDSNPAYYTVGTSNYDWRGFRAAFYADADGSIGMGDQTVRLGATAALAIEPPHASDGRYPASLDAYTWHISPWYAASSITLALSWVGLADCDDTLSVYDGPSAAAPLLGTFCGGILPSQRWLQSSGTHITAVLATDSDDDRDAGFNLGYFSEGEQYRCGYAGNGPGYLSPPSFVFTDGSLSSAPMGGESSGAYECTWIVKPQTPDGAGAADRVHLALSRADLRGGRLLVTDGEAAGGSVLLDCRECDHVPPPVASTGGALRVSLDPSWTAAGAAANSAAVGSGFGARYYAEFPGARGMGDRLVELHAASATGVSALFFALGTDDERAGGGLSLTHVWQIDVDRSSVALDEADAFLDGAEADPEVADDAFAEDIPVEESVVLAWSDLVVPAVDGGAGGGCRGNVTVYDGPSDLAPVLHTYCAAAHDDEPPPHAWLRSSGPTLRIEASVEAAATGDGDAARRTALEMAYFSDRSKYRCGHAADPGVLQAPSMIFSDGSAPRSRMRRPETCRWEIRGSPRFWPTASSGSGRSSELVLQLPFVDLRGARVNVTDADGARLWTCDACTDAPPAIVTVTDVLHVTFEVVDMPADPRLFVGDDDLAVVPEDAVLVEEGAADGDPDEYAVPGRMSDADYAAYAETGYGFKAHYLTVEAAPPRAANATLLQMPGTYLDDALSGPSVMEWEWEQQLGYTWDIVLGSASGVTSSEARAAEAAAREALKMADADEVARGAVYVPSHPATALVFGNARAGPCADAAAVIRDGNDASPLPSLAVRPSVQCGAVFGAFFRGATEAQPAPTPAPGAEQAVDPAALALTLDGPRSSRRAVPGRRLYRTSEAGQQCEQWRMPGGSDPDAARLAAEHQAATAAAGNATATAGPSSVELSPACQWHITTPQRASELTLTLADIALQDRARLRVYAGSSTGGELLYACRGCAPAATTIVINAACGKVFMTYTLNETVAWSPEDAAAADGAGGNASSYLNPDAATAQMAYSPKTAAGPETSGFVANYRWTAHADLAPEPSRAALYRAYRSTLCVDDPLYLPPLPVVEDDMTGLIILAVVLTVLFLCGAASYPLFKLYKEREEMRNFPIGVGKVTQGVGPSNGLLGLLRGHFSGSFLDATQNHTQRHPTYLGVVDKLLNYALPSAECCICYSNERAFALPCEHHICIDDMRSYIKAALGDVAMFPLKCPMHHVGCVHTIGPDHAKRVLSRPEYTKFCEFNDRAIFGEGINCLKCGCFVNFPASSGNPMVMCPYCRYRFCIKCKTAWHSGVKCEERADVELEEWRRSKGAQRCPACVKIIEKDDVETCNHMCHKQGDGCVRERCDFCYCCGVEVLPDYPHDELLNPGTNHFPDGVFNDCRIVKEGGSPMRSNSGGGGRQRRNALQGGGRRRRDAVQPLEMYQANTYLQYFGNGEEGAGGGGRGGGRRAGRAAGRGRRRGGANGAPVDNRRVGGF